MFFYTVLFLLTTLVFFLAGRCRSVLCVVLDGIALLIPCIVAAARDSTVGTDLTRYGTWDFNSVSVHGFSDGLRVLLDSQQPFGYSVITSLDVSLFHSMPVHLFILQVLTILPYYCAARYFVEKEQMWIAMLWYMTMLYPNSLNIMKQMIAVSLLLLAIIPVYNRQKVRFLITIVIAYSFHQTAILGILLYPFGRFILANSRVRNGLSQGGKDSLQKEESRGLLFRAGLLLGVSFAFIALIAGGTELLSKVASLKGSYSYALEHVGEGSFSSLYFLLLLLLIVIGTMYYCFSYSQRFRDISESKAAAEDLIQRNQLDYLFFSLAFIGVLTQQAAVITENFYRFSFYGLVFGGVYFGRKLAEQKAWLPQYRLVLWVLDIAMIVAQFVIFYKMCVVAGGNEIVPYTSQILGINAPID